MKQVMLRGGEAIVEEVPASRPAPGQVLVKVAWSCVSPGTELASAERMRTANVLERFRRDPARLRKAFELLRDSGVKAFYNTAQEKLTVSVPSGYSCAGSVIELGPEVEGFAVGDYVACAGSEFAHHADFVSVPVNLVARIPAGVSLADAATVTLGAIALQGVRRAGVAVGERIGVIGLGFLGQLTVQILKASGCKVFGVDLEAERVAQAKELGLDAAPDSEPDIVAAAQRFSEGYGLDVVILTASTASHDPLNLAMQMSRRKGRIVVVGDVGLSIKREAMYAKELDLLMSTSYGPGRYDPSYEEEGLDYPYAYVRWTEHRNMQAYLELIAAGRVTLTPLTSRRLPVREAAEAFRLLQDARPRPYTVLLEYAAEIERHATRQVAVTTVAPPTQSGTTRLAILGAGSFARNMHFPNLQRLTDRFRIEAIVTQHGPKAVAMARRIGARVAATDYKGILTDPAVDAVLIATRHHLHAEMVQAALCAGKHVFVEKPLALSEDELMMLEEQVDELSTSPSGCPVVFVGFNRRYSPYAIRLHSRIAERSTPLQISYRMNAGYLPPEHWTHGVEGGGRIVGEACHIFDLFRFLVGAPAVEVCATGIRARRSDVSPTDNFTATLRYAEGSVCTLLYTAQGGRDLPKEALELHVDGQSFLVDDYRRLRGFGAKADFRTKGQDKGHSQELIGFHQAIAGAVDRKALWDEAVEVTRTALEVDRQVRSH